MPVSPFEPAKEVAATAFEATRPGQPGRSRRARPESRKSSDRRRAVSRARDDGAEGRRAAVVAPPPNLGVGRRRRSGRPAGGARGHRRPLISSLCSSHAIGMASLSAPRLASRHRRSWNAPLPAARRQCCSRQWPKSGRVASALLRQPRKTGCARSACCGDDEEALMNLFVWLPAMFVLGLASTAVCLAFTIGCEHI
jgi:hypothetical protein